MNTIDQAEKLIDEVCNYYELDRSILYKKSGVKPVRLVTRKEGRKRVKIDISAIKMILSYLLTKYTAIPINIIGPLVGYADHTTIPYAKKKIANYMETNDEKFLTYWNPINKVADDIGIRRDYERLTKKVIHMVPV